jgi:hypothetical protein
MTWIFALLPAIANAAPIVFLAVSHEVPAPLSSLLAADTKMSVCAERVKA